MNGRQARKIRELAKQQASQENKTVNVNLNVKPMKGGKRVLNDDAVSVDEMVPVVTYTTKYVDGSYRKAVKQLKKDYYNG